METKELKIQVPEGYEIDKENSTFECIRFKPIKKDITYDDVCNVLFVNDTYYTSDRGYIYKGATWDNEIIPDKNIATNRKQLEKLLSLNQLLNIAEYYNTLHTEIIKNNSIVYDNVNKEYKINLVSVMHLCGIKAIFNRREDAQAVIDNPNFREILDTIYKD
jgi:hypothetical protein